MAISDVYNSINKENKIIFWGLIIILMLFGFADFTTYLGLLISLFGWILVLNKEGIKSAINPLTIPFIAMLGLMLLSFFYVRDLSDALSMLGTYVEIFLAYHISYYFLKKQRNKIENILLWSFFIGGVIVSLGGLYEFFILGVRRAASLVNNANILGIYMLFLIIFSLGLSFDNDNWKKKIIIIILTILFTLNLFFSASRAAFLGLLVSVFSYSMLRDKRILLLILMIIIMSFCFSNTLYNRLYDTYEDFFSGKKESRFFIWKNAINMFKENPLIGVGVGQFYSNYVIEPEAPIQYRKFNHAHNIFLQVIAELGLMGFLVFAWMLYIIFKETVLYLKNSTGKKNMVFIFISLWLGFIAQELFEFSIIDAGGISILVGILLGWHMALLSKCSRKVRI